jgi:DNA-binding transcriptional MocR family regulator
MMRTPIDQMDGAALRDLHQSLLAEYAGIQARGLRLNIARGKPSADQLDLSNALLALPRPDDFTTKSGDDARNYGGDPLGLIELREIFAPILGTTPDRVVAGGNSSLAMMHDIIVWALLKGLPGGTGPWVTQGEVAFLCPTPGYELHQNMCAEYGIQLWPIPVNSDGPDMDVVERLALDPRAKGMWCVPTYANPTGEIWSDAVVDRLATMPTGSSDFRLFWDNAYVVHHLGEERKVAKNILHTAEAAGHADRPLVFASTSKITFSGGGVAFLAASALNIGWYLDRAKRRGPGSDKINQLRHARFLKDAETIAGHMERHRLILAPKFAVLLDTFDRRLSGWGAAEWTRPVGGYFISLETLPGAAAHAVALAEQAGVSLTVAGSTWPYGKDPADSNIRIAPSFATLEDVTIAADVIAVSVLLAAAERVMRRNRPHHESPNPSTANVFAALNVSSSEA